MLYNGKNIYEDSIKTNDIFRKNYAEGIDAFIENLNRQGEKNRNKFMEGLTDLEAMRQEYLKMLGIDNKAMFNSSKPAEKVLVAKDDLSTIYRLCIYLTDEIPVYALLFVPHAVKDKAPLVVMQHGGGGSPELCMDLIGENNYTNTGLRILERGAVVLAPQLMLWSYQGVEHGRMSDVPFDRAKTDANLKRFGLSITGLEVMAIMKCIDYASGLDVVDSNHIGMIGLSYGGFFTMHTMAADTRINVGLNCACFNSRDAYPWFDMTYRNSANTFHDAEVAALCAPRKLYISIGKEDKVFDWQAGEKEAERAKTYFDAMNCSDNLFVTVWDGGHKVKPVDEPIDYLFDNI